VCLVKLDAWLYYIVHDFVMSNSLEVMGVITFLTYVDLPIVCLKFIPKIPRKHTNFGLTTSHTSQGP
jgi:hypothetical protein